MSILESEVSITLNPANYRYYENLGYELPKYLNEGNITIKFGEEIVIKVEDLSKGSHTILTKICDDCKKVISKQKYALILRNRKRGDGKDRCRECGRKKGEKTKKSNISYEKSLSYYAEKNDKIYLLNEFSNKNNIGPSEILFASNDKYLWNCNHCQSEYPASVNNRTSGGCNCPYCANQKVNNTNCLWTTEPEVAKLLTNPEDGYQFTKGSGEKAKFTCPICNNSFMKVVKNVVNLGIGCTRCSDGLSYPEKFMINLLSQSELHYETQKIFEWSLNKRYDFYIPSLNCIIETHGAQHFYENTFNHLGGRSLKEEQLNDELKRNLAINNGIEYYIVVDCSKSELNYIKNSIVNSNLGNVIELSDINWLKCHEFSCGTLVKTACEIWNSSQLTTTEIGKLLNLERSTIRRYLRRGSELGWCDYSKEEFSKRNNKSKGAWNTREVVQLSKNGDFVKQWNSTSEAARSLNIFSSNISRVCRGQLKSTGGFKWIYKEDYKK